MLYQIISGLRYHLFSKHKKGYAIHSPFVFNFIRKVMMGAGQNKCVPFVYREFKNFARTYKYEPSNNEFGAGSKREKSSSDLNKLAKTSGMKPKYLKLICEMVSYFEIGRFLELGTCCGVTSAAMAKTMSNGFVTTIEGNESRANAANQFFKHLQLSNINLQIGAFDEVLPKIAEVEKKYDLAFIDGDHTYEATTKNFYAVASMMNENGIIIVDDIYWSKEMTVAWREIIKSEAAVITVDLFRMGIVFLGRKQAKQNFVIRF